MLEREKSISNAVRQGCWCVVPRPWGRSPQAPGPRKHILIAFTIDFLCFEVLFDRSLQVLRRASILASLLI